MSLTACAGPICYSRGYKYQNNRTWWVQTEILGVTASVPGYIDLAPDGRLTIHEGYAWDGASRPAIDTRDFMRGSLAHDAGYQLIREGKISDRHREAFDELLVKLCKEDGMRSIRARWVLWAVKNFAAHAAARRDRELLYAGVDPNLP